MVKKLLSPETRRRVLATARANKGKILRECLPDGDGNISIRCSQGHESKANPFNIAKGVWCGKQPCLGERISRQRKARTLEKQKNKFKKFCDMHGLKVVNGTYKNQKSKFKVSCENGHEFKINFEPLPKHHPCLDCRIKRKEEEAKVIIETNGYSLISTEIEKNEQMICHIACAEGHEWHSNLINIREGVRCAKCHYLFPNITLAKLTKKQKQKLIAEAVKPAVERLSGKVNKADIVNRSGKTEYRVNVSCENGHTWETSAQNIMRGHWCGDCSTFNVHETICRTLLEHIVGKPFPKKRLPWLLNSRGNKMELDGYNEEVSIGFEYQGVQHYEFVEFFHSSETEFERRQIDDGLKRKYCKKNKVHLINIPYSIPKDELQAFLTSSINEFAPNLILNLEVLKINKIKTGKAAELEKVRKIATDNDGKLISENYIDSQTKLEFECSKGHRWKAVPSSVINQGSWCGDRQCVAELISLKRRRKTVIKMEALLSEKGAGKIVSIYPRQKQVHTLFKLECENGHLFDTDLGRVKNGNWCSHCHHIERGASQRLTIEDIQTTALEKKGRLVSKCYLNAQKKLLWQCEQGHLWTATANSVRETKKRKGSWCPVCINKNDGFTGNVKRFLAEEKAAFEEKLALKPRK